MGASSFNEMELDAIGEIMNISLGASATAVSTMLGTMVNITTPVVSVLTRDEFEFRRLEPAIGVEIAYVEGLDGKNIMMFRREDVGIIVGTLLGEDPAEMDFELDEIHISAICEVMNQMMGASATALSEFLGTIVNISTPKSFDIGDPEDFKVKYFPEKDGMVVVRFRLEIEGKMNSEFMNIMSISLTKRLLAPFEASFAAAAPAAEPAPAPAAAPAPEPSSGGGTMSQDEINAMLAGLPGIPAAPAPEPSSGGGTMSQDEINAMLAGASGDAPAQPSSGGGTMSQDEINAMLAGTSGSAPAQTSSGGGTMSQDEINAMLGGAPGSAPAPQPAPGAVPQMQPGMAQQPGQPYYPYPPMGMDPMMLQLFTQMQQTQMQMMEMMKASSKPAEAAPSQNTSSGGSIIRPLASSQIQDEAGLGEEDKTNQEMLMKVPLEISVEIGRTKRLVRDILEFTQGTLVVLDKMAGEQVDLFVNGQCIAKGDIVVVEDNFGIRITEIVTRELNPESL
ncbi:MAG: flagellar motor switch protein FliN [Hungatella sp.]|nr:flagellar motor switch protein FliN [Hungatella sp.]